jgi:hypothetical protein
MTDQIVTLTPRDIATRIEEEASNLKVCRSLMEDALQFLPGDSEASGMAQSKLFFLVAAMGDLQKRLEALQDAAYAAAFAQKAAA